jgi:hypothetical protein
MTSVRMVAIASLGVACAGQPVFAQSLSQYREYALESTVASVLGNSGARETDTKTLHERPAKIQELLWRAPYVLTGAQLADPVRDVMFSFYNDQLYQVVIAYDRARTEGLTNDDLIESISATYGVPALPHAKTARGLPPADADTAVVARWDDGASSLTLMRGIYSPELQLVLVSKALSARARSAIAEARRLDARAAPQREVDERKKEVAAARVANEKVRVLNKAAFKP